MHYKKIVFFVIVVIAVLTINNLAHSIYVIWQKQNLITNAQRNLDEEKRENSKLKENIAKVNKPQFIETQARDNLNLAKPQEAIVVIPTSTITKPTSSSHTDARTNWQRWLDFFFNS